MLYDGLKSVGYEMSEEELQLQAGTHPLLTQASALYDAFKEEMKNAKKKASKK